jgi:hypothetical protein
MTLMPAAIDNHSLAGSAHAATARLVDAADVLAALTPFPWPGLVADSDTSDLAKEIREFAPGLALPLQIAGRLGRPAEPAALIRRTGTRSTEYRIYPYIVAWPCTTPTLNNASILEQPVFTARPGDSVFLQVTWQFNAGYRLNSSNAVIVISAAPLEDSNDLSALPTPPTGTQRTWHHQLGTFNTAGEFVSTGYTSPFVPPQL